MHLKDLKNKKPAELVSMAEELEIEGASTLRKQDLMFAILKEMAEDGEQIIGDDDVVENCVRLIACETPLLAIAGGSGISANSSGEVTAKQPASGNWTAGSITYTAWNPTGVAISSNALCLIYPVDAKWVALELC